MLLNKSRISGKWMLLCTFLFGLSVAAHAVPNIQGKVTHQITSPGSSHSIGSDESLRIDWNHTSSTYEANNIQLAYFMLWHLDNNGNEVILRPNKNYFYNVPPMSVGTHTFKVRAVQDYTDGTRKYGGYSSAITVNVINPVQHQVTHSVSAPGSTIIGSDITFSWSPLTAFSHLNFSHVKYGIKSPSGGYSYNNTSSTSHTFTANEAGQWCFKVRGSHDGVLGNYSSEQCTNVSGPVYASNLFKAGASTGANHSSCMPSDMYFGWHKETRQVQSRINGHIVGVSGNSLNADNSISGCSIPNSDVDSSPFKVSEAARQQINQRPANDNMLYVRSHACETACSETRAEISYDSKKFRSSFYSDGDTHTQNNDIFWVTYRFNPISLFESGLSYSKPPHIFLSQFHPETLATGGTCQEPCELTKDHSPSFAMILLPYTGNEGYDAELRFRTKYWESATATEVGNYDMGSAKGINLKSWYQVKIGIKFSTDHSSGWAIAALRKEGDLNWDYFGIGDSEGTIFRGKTLHAAPCSLGGEIGQKREDAPGYYPGDCQSGQQHYETVFKSGAYYGNLPDSWKGQVDKQYEILLDDYFASDNHHEQNTWQWPAHLSTTTDYIINDSNLNNLPFTEDSIPVTHKNF